MLTKLFGAFAAGSAGVYYGLTLGPYGGIGGGAVGFVTGFSTIYKVEKAVSEQFAALKEEGKAVISKEGKKVCDGIRNAQKRTVESFNDNMQKLYFAIGAVLFPYLGSTLSAFASPAQQGSFKEFCSTISFPVLSTIGWISGVSFLRSAILKSKNVTFEDTSKRTLKFAAGVLMSYGGWLAGKSAWSGTYEFGGKISTLVRSGCLLSSVSLISIGALFTIAAYTAESKHEKSKK